MSPAQAGAPGSRAVGVKICGITRVSDGVAAVASGADAIGIVFAEQSKRRVGLATAPHLLSSIRAGAPRPFLAVAVLGSLDPGTGRRMIEDLGFDRVQFHGAEHVRELWSCVLSLEEFAARLWGVVRVKDPASFEGYAEVPCEAFVLDTWREDILGGGGMPFPWELAVPFARIRPSVLAGGLTPENVAGAIGVVRPWMVDVSSGVESAPGIKDPSRVGAFVEAVRHATS